MRNYYKFTKIINDKESISYYNSLSDNLLKIILDNEFNDIDNYLDYYAFYFKNYYKGFDYDEHYYDMLVLTEQLNDIKIILNILKERDKNEKKTFQLFR